MTWKEGETRPYVYPVTARHTGDALTVSEDPRTVHNAVKKTTAIKHCTEWSTGRAVTTRQLHFAMSMLQYLWDTRGKSVPLRSYGISLNLKRTLAL